MLIQPWAASAVEGTALAGSPVEFILFALLARHVEKSHAPIILPKHLPHDWKGAFQMLVMVFVWSSFLDNIAAASSQFPFSEVAV